MRRLAIAAAMAILLLMAGCSDGEPTVAPTTSGPTPTTTSQAPSSEFADCRRRPSGSSPAVFDPSTGTYAAQSLTIVGERQIQFDVVQWLSGEDADEAYFRDSGDDSGVPNDYYIVNERDELRTARVADDAVILVLTVDGNPRSLQVVPFESLPADERQRTFWLAFSDGVITEICQQYQP